MLQGMAIGAVSGLTFGIAGGVIQFAEITHPIIQSAIYAGASAASKQISEAIVGSNAGSDAIYSESSPHYSSLSHLLRCRRYEYVNSSFQRPVDIMNGAKSVLSADPTTGGSGFYSDSWGGGFVSLGSGYATGWGAQDPNSIARSAAGGLYIGAKRSGYGEIGAFESSSRERIAGARFGGGINIGIYHGVCAREFFDGELEYETWSYVIGGYTRYYYNGKVAGNELNVWGKGIGLGWERGLSRGSSWALQ